MRTELHNSEFRSEFMRFSNLEGAEHWRRRVKVMRQQIQAKRLLRELLLDENSIAVGLAECEEILKRFSQTGDRPLFSGNPNNVFFNPALPVRVAVQVALPPHGSQVLSRSAPRSRNWGQTLFSGNPNNVFFNPALPVRVAVQVALPPHGSQVLPRSAPRRVDRRARNCHWSHVEFVRQALAPIGPGTFGDMLPGEN
jgi:hypothetical protein